MTRIGKVDFYCGAFLSYLVTNRVEPILLDATDKSKRIQFALRDQDYSVYLKYVGTGKSSEKQGKTFYKWDAVFTAAEKGVLMTEYQDKKQNNLLVIVCTTEDFKDTFFAVIPIEDALDCLGKDSINNHPRISIRRQKGSSNVSIYGTALSDKNAKIIKYDCDTYFGFK